MSATLSASAEPAAPAPKGGKKTLLMLAVPVVLAAAGAGLWFSGIGPKLLGHKPPAPVAAAVAPAGQPVFAELPDLIANLNTAPHHQSFIKVKVKLELAQPSDQAVLALCMPRLLDLFQTYLREQRPEELRGSAGTYRLREELIARANIAMAPARVNDVLFTEMLIQ
jgi:flagellar FliL protein